MAKILLVEDDNTLALSVKDWLEDESHIVDIVSEGKEALDRLRLYSYDVAILDWQLPGEIDGIKVCEQYRSSGGAAPILMLTGRAALDDKTEGLDAGADDYLPKPFHPKELSARLRALLRRPVAFSADTVRAGNISVDRKSLTVKADDKVIELLPKEYALLEFLVRHPGETFSAEALIERIWSSESEASPDTIRVHIAKLRQKLGDADAIKTVHRVGYKLEAK
jgi:DNA-binding response OmpR family regulator